MYVDYDTLYHIENVIANLIKEYNYINNFCFYRRCDKNELNVIINMPMMEHIADNIQGDSIVRKIMELDIPKYFTLCAEIKYID